MKIKEIINNLEDFNNIINEELNQKYEIDIPRYDNIDRLEHQNELINNLVNEFNLGTNSQIYKFKNTDDNKIKNIIFSSPMFLEKIYLYIDNFIYTNLVKFKVTFYTIDNMAITRYMLPYDFRGEYIERIKFYTGQVKSDFKTINSDKVFYYDIIKNSDNEILKKLEFDYTEEIDDEGYIIFKKDHKKDILAVKYTPISSSFTTEINDRITSITLELDKDINYEIELRIYK